MRTIQLDIPEELERKLQPYRRQVVELLELGLEEWQRRERMAATSERERLLAVLRSAEGITLPDPHRSEPLRSKWTPVPVEGRPVSEIVVSLRD